MGILDRILGRKKIDPEMAQQMGLNSEGQALVEGKTATELQQEATNLTQQMDAEVKSWQTDLPQAEAEALKREAEAREIEARLNAAERK